jgi:serine/threonine-protein kinase
MYASWAAGAAVVETAMMTPNPEIENASLGASLDSNLEEAFQNQESGQSMASSRMSSRADGVGLDPELPDEVFAVPAEKPRRQATPKKKSGKTTTSKSSSNKYESEQVVPIGAVIDKYRVEEVIGTGGFAIVYRAIHMPLSMPVALKMLRPRIIAERPYLAERLYDEARYAARIDHPNVVRVIDVAHSAQLTYEVMEYVDKGSLASAIRAERRLPPDKAARIARDVAAGLAAGLDKGLVHRDIKPANVLLTASGQAKIADFGLARLLSSIPHPTHDLIGTPGYIAPEQIEKPGQGDFRSDIYSLGVTLYYSLVGAPPFPNDDVERCLRQHRYETPESPISRVPSVPRELSDLVMELLAKDPAKRPQSYGALISALQKFV